MSNISAVSRRNGRENRRKVLVGSLRASTRARSLSTCWLLFSVGLPICCATAHVFSLQRSTTESFFIASKKKMLESEEESSTLPPFVDQVRADGFFSFCPDERLNQIKKWLYESEKSGFSITFLDSSRQFTQHIQKMAPFLFFNQETVELFLSRIHLLEPDQYSSQIDFKNLESRSIVVHILGTQPSSSAPYPSDMLIHGSLASGYPDRYICYCPPQYPRFTNVFVTSRRFQSILVSSLKSLIVFLLSKATP